MKTWLLAATALAGGFALPAGVFAQTAPAPATPASTATAAADDASTETLVVTGSRIRRPNLESTVPIVSIAGEEFFQTGSISVGDTLNDLPQLRSTVSQQNSTSGLGLRGVNLLDLRGLGPARTLVLVNGRRHVAGGLLNNQGVSPDINTFPTDLIERVDIITGGNSSIYGSDAIAGVVNFVLKQDFDGVQVRGQSGISKYGDAGNQYVSGLIGKNFADGRGNVALNVEYAHQERFYSANRANIRQNDGFVIVDTDPAGSVNGSDGIPDRLFFRDIRSSTIARGGRASIRQSLTNPTCGADAVGGVFTCGLLFEPGGALVPQTGDRVGVGPNGSYIGGNGYRNGRDTNLLVLSPDVERINVNLIGKFEVSPAFVPFVEAKYVRADAFGSQSGPLFMQGATIGAQERPRVDNPYLSTEARNLLTQQLLATTTNANPSQGTTANLSAAALATQRAAINAGTFRFDLQKNWEELGVRDENIRRETYRAVVGVRGDFNDDWNYEVSLNYGEHREVNVIQSNINTQRFLLAMDAARDPVTNAIVCRSKFDPAAAGTDRAGNAAVLAADVAACVPINPFGDGSVTQAARQYLTVDSRATSDLTQFVASGFVAGDLSQLFELPGGPIGFAAGAEYRKETVAYDLDATTKAGYAFYNAIPALVAPAFEVKEAFAEISVPILKDVPLFQELTLTGSGRVSDYNNAVGTVWTYAGGVDWSPVRDLRFRAAYSRAIRSPALRDLFAAQGQNFAPAPNDPCSARNIATGTSTRAANCTAAGRPANYDFVYTSSLEIISGGNPGLKEEKSTSITLGGVYSPSFIPGLSLTVDYYDIEVKDVIQSVSAQNILNSCYDAADLNNVFCGLIKRAGVGGGPRGEQPFRVLEGSLLVSAINYAKRTARGIDTQLSYRQSFDWGSAGFRALWVRSLERNNFEIPTDPGRINRVLGELGDPENEINLNANVTFGNVTFGYQMRWIDGMYLNTFEDFNELQGRAPENADWAGFQKYPAVSYHDLRVAFDATKQVNVYFGVDNVGDKKAPLGLTGVGDGSGIYDVRGRYLYLGFVGKF